MSLLPVIDAAQAAAWDRRAREVAKVPSRVLMESAGRGAAQVVARHFGDKLASSEGVLVAAGHGNNGGDGWVIARALRAMGTRVWAVETGSKRSPDCESNRQLALDEGVELMNSAAQWPRAGVLIDGLLGTGASGLLRGKVGDLAEGLAAHGSPIAAVDGPTGLDLSTGEVHGPVRAALTVTFGGLRRGHLLARDRCGRLVAIDIGFPEADRDWPSVVDDRWAGERLPGFRADMHKGDRGRVLVVGGDHGMAGAAIHAARAALEAGAGLAKIAATEATVRAAQASLPDALTVPTSLGPDVDPGLAEALEWADAIAVGPGLGRHPDRGPFVKALLETEKPIVVDADALHAIPSGPATRRPRVLTPHVGEFRSAFPDLSQQVDDDRFAAAAAGANASGATVLLKGVPTVIAAPGRASLVVAAGNPALATGGTGDVLAGFIAAFLARGLAPQDAAALGAQVMGRSAELAAALHGVRSTRPADVLESLPDLWRALAEPPILVPPILLDLAPPALA